jgi:hypothetical protein
MALGKSRAMLSEAGVRGPRFQVAALLAALAAGCSVPAPKLVPPPATDVPKVYHSMPAAPLPLQPESRAATLAEYQLEVAGLLHTANAGRIFQGPPPNPLRGVVVMRAEVDALGEMRRLDLFRGPGHAPWLESLAAQTVREAEPFPRPSAKLLNGASSVVFTETWLFDYQGRFRLRSLSGAQADPPPVPDDEEYLR